MNFKSESSYTSMKSTNCISTYILAGILVLGMSGCSTNPEEETKAPSFRALSTSSDDVIWAASSEGLVIKSVDGGDRFDTVSVQGFIGEFRDIHAWNKDSAVVMGIESPGVIFRTTDGGATWTEVFRKTHEKTFFDQMDFNSSGSGIVIGDPIDGSWTILGTNDYGEHWIELDKNYGFSAEDTDVSFAASGSALITTANNYYAFTGGNGAKILSYNPRINARLWSDTSSTSGIYSAAMINDSQFVFVGGDYKRETSSDNAAGIININGFEADVTWATQPPAGYRSCVIQMSDGRFLCCGPTGIDISEDGLHWTAISDRSAHVLSRSKKGIRIWAAGHGELWEVTPLLPQDSETTLGTQP